MNNYDDIINLPHHTSSKRTRMSLENRSAQFAPFSALTGYSEAINETKRLTDKKHEIDEERKNMLNNKLQILNDNIKNKPEVTITYFVKDNKKTGGSYKIVTSNIKKIDTYEQVIILEDKTKISLDNIYEIKGEIFTNILEEDS